MKYLKDSQIIQYPLYSIQYLRSHPRRLVFNFHRVSQKKDPQKNPFHFLSTISLSQFEIFIKIMKRLGRFENLENLLSENDGPSFRPYFHLTFDDVSTSFLKNVLSLIEKHQIPVTLFPSGQNTEKGYNWRDKIYYILNSSELTKELIHKTQHFFGKEVIANEKNIYRLTKKPNLNHRTLETQIIDPIMKDCMDDFLEKVKRFQPYLNWKEIKKLAENPLITLGNHSYNHYNLNSLSEDEIEEDILKNHNLILEKTGIWCRHFSVPFGNIQQKSFLAADKTLSGLDYKSVGWVKRVNNPRLPKNGLRHYFRIDSSPFFLINLIKTGKAFPQTQYFPLSGISFSSFSEPQKNVNFTTQVSMDEYKTFFRRMKPQSLHHQNEDYINHLYYKNPYREEKPVHLAIKGDNQTFALGSLFHVPFLLKGKRVKGAYFCGWYRFPQFPSKTLRAKYIFEKAQEFTSVLGAYSPSLQSLNFYKNWDRVEIYRMKSHIKKSKTRQVNPQYSLSNEWSPLLKKIITKAHKNLNITIFRGEELYQWRAENYPLCQYSYLYPPGSDPGWFVIFCRSREIMYVSDFCVINLQDTPLISEMLSAVYKYAFQNSIRELQIETSNPLVVQLGKKYGFKKEKMFFNVYNHPQAKGNILSWKKVHETQICGDLLPRPVSRI